MTAWQYFAGAGLVAALCPLHGHVAVAGDGHGRGARVDVCVPGGHPKPPTARPDPAVPPPPGVPAAPSPIAPPPPRVTLPGASAPTVRHVGRAPDLPGAPGAIGTPAAPAPQAPPPATPEPEPVPATAPAPPGPPAALKRVSAFHTRPYHSAALARRNAGGLSTMMLMVVVTTPSVLAAAALRPRSSGRGGAARS